MPLKENSPPPPKLDKEDLYDFGKGNKKKRYKSESLKIAARKGRENFRNEANVYHPWTNFLLSMANIQVEAMKAGQKTARKHLIAIMKELEYNVGFRFELIDSETHQDDPRRG